MVALLLRRGLGAALLCGALCACTPETVHRPVLVTVSGLQDNVTALRVDSLLDGRPATEIKELRRGLNRFGLRLPEGSRGELVIQVDALRLDRCVVGRGFGRVAVGALPNPEVAVPLRTLGEPLCLCSTGTGWCWESPLPQGNHLRGVFSLSDTDAWAVGDHGTVLRFDGATWYPVPSGTNAHLYAIWGSASDNMWAVGERGTVRRWDGTAWSGVSTGDRVETDLDAVWGFAGGEVWATGVDGTVVRVVGGTTLLSEFVGTRRRLRAVWGDTPEQIWVAGDDGVILTRKGQGWTAPTGVRTDKDLYGIYGYSGRDVWAVGEAGTILRVVAGEARLERAPLAANLAAVWVAPSPGDPPPPEPDEVWAVGAVLGIQEGVVMRRVRGHWELVPVASTDAANVLAGVHGSRIEDVWAVGLYGTLLRWREGQERALGARDTSRALRAIWGSGPEDVWAVGGHEGPPAQGATLLHYDGTTWRPDAKVERTGEELRSVWGTGPADVWAVGRAGTVLHYDGSWRAEDVSALTRVDLNAVWAGGGEVWIVGGTGTVLRRVGGGFAKVPVDPTYELGCVWGAAGPGPLEVWIGGGDVQGRGVLLRGRDGVLDLMPTGLIPRVVAVAGSGPRDVWAAVDKSPMLHFDGQRLEPQETGTTRSLVGMWFFSPQDGWAVGEDGRIFLWNGNTWARLISGTNNDLDAVWGTSQHNLWAVGHGGTILRQRL